MTLDLPSTARGQWAQLRSAPTGKRIRALVDGEAVADSTDAWLVWEPRRIVPVYAVPRGDVRTELVDAGPALRGSTDELPEDLREAEVVWPGVPFAVHTTAGQPLTVRVGGTAREGAAFIPSDPDLDGRVLLDFDQLDTWLEEDEEVKGHPRDPYHRVDTRRSSRHVRVELDGVVLAESDRPVMVFETGLPPRPYLPREDVRTDLLVPSDTTSRCAYKGLATYSTLRSDDGVQADLVWSYEDPLDGCREIAGLLAFDRPATVTVD